MSRHIEGGLLDPLASKVAMMRAAGASLETIALDSECSIESIRGITLRPEVARKIIILEAMIGRATAGSIRDLDEAIQEKAARAFEVETASMEALSEIGTRNDGEDDSIAIKAYTAAATTAQDILDRAGKRAPTRVISGRVTGAIPEDAIDKVGEVLKEMSLTLTESR